MTQIARENLMLIKVRILFLSLLLATLLAGCANLTPGFEEPSVEVTSIRLNDSGGLAPEFDIALRLTNPNRDALNIDGMTYTLYLADNKVVSGVSNDLPTVPAYGAAEVRLRATLSLFGSLNLLNDLMSQYQNSIDYELVTKLDVGRFYPKITVKQQGLFNF